LAGIVLSKKEKMRVYIGFDDTDVLNSDFGTGKVARRYERLLPEGCKIWGVVRQQLLMDPAIPYTSHNSSACVVVNCPDQSYVETLKNAAITHIEAMSVPGSDPGLCLVGEKDSALPTLESFGLLCTAKIVSQNDAIRAVGCAHLSGHGGTNDGIIGAAAAVGLTASGWNGRFIEYSGLREFPEQVAVSALLQKNIRVISLDRDACCPRPEDIVNTKGWLRPRLWGNAAVLPVKPAGNGLWENLGEKRNPNKQNI
jgi:tRNA(Ile2) C34 agmatinyltransferase TiaS